MYPHYMYNKHSRLNFVLNQMEESIKYAQLASRVWYESASNVALILCLYKCNANTSFNIIKGPAENTKQYLYINPCSAEPRIIFFENIVDPGQLASDEAI